MAGLERLQLTRESLGMTPAALAEAVGIDQATLLAYEAGRKRPEPEHLFDLGEALYADHHFISDAGKVAGVSTLSETIDRLSAAERARLMAQARICLDNYLRLDRLVRENIPDSLVTWEYPEGFPYQVSSASEAAQCAMSARTSWGLGVAEIRSVASLLEDHGVVVGLADLRAEFDAIAYVGEDSAHTPVILVQHDLNGSRQRFALARELAYFLIANATAQSAAHFAGAFLVPEVPLMWELGKARDALDPLEVRLLAAKFGLTLHGLVARAASVRIISKDAYDEWVEAIGEMDEEETAAIEEDVSMELPGRMLRLAVRLQAEGLIDDEQAGDLLTMPWLNVEEE